MYIAKKLAAATSIVAGLFVVASSAFAAEKADFDWKACKVELAKFCKDVKGDEKIWACLQKHDDDLSRTCDASHGKYEELTGKKKP